MQLAAAGLFAVEAVYSVAVTLIFVNHDNMLRAVRAQGTQIPAGTSVDTIINIAIASTIGVVIFFAVCQLVGAAGSYLGWRWMSFSDSVGSEPSRVYRPSSAQTPRPYRCLPC
jgi:hypothetical protein